MTDETIARINELYHKSKAEGLTPDEKEEQARLRREYIEAIRGNMRATLDHTSIQNEDGTLTPLKIVREQNLAKKNADKVSDIDVSDEELSDSDENDVQKISQNNDSNGNRDNVKSIDKIIKRKILEQKKQIRKELKEKRNVLSDREVRQRSGIICYHLLQSDEYKNVSSVCVYRAFRNEVSCDDIIEQAYEDGKKVYVPVVDKDKGTMDFYEITKDTEWTDDSYGIKEPVIDDTSIKLGPEDKALIVMPGLAFDKNKHRIGYGGGFYDRYLAKYPGHTTMALCYSFQIVDAKLPYDEQDVLPHFIVSEDGVI